ncbi:MAG: hypothetical protein QOJ75_2328, partial [Chloroflexota bacterium]|nr:hypothetical protein [Chloroflexota bacterium]
GPLFTLVSIAIPVGTACLAVGMTVTIGPRVVLLLRQRSYDRATTGERLLWTLRLAPRAAADRDGAVVVEIDHGSAVSLYGHLQSALLVTEGESVSAGEPLGAVGLTGNTTGPHLHFEILVSGEPIDPLLVLPSTGSQGGSP